MFEHPCEPEGEERKRVDGGRVLLVDDSRSIRSYVSDLLMRAGYTVSTANDGSEGLIALELEQPDLVLLDVEMPQMGGLEVLASLRGVPRLYTIILFTTRSTVEEIIYGLDCGADDYVVKPFRDDELLARVAVAVRTAREKCALNDARQQAEAATRQLQQAQQQLVAEERSLAIAHLAAGAAHQINNPLGFILSNLKSFERYSRELHAYIQAINEAFRATGAKAAALIDELQQQHRLKRIEKDCPELLTETNQGAKRIALIVKSLGELELGLVRQEPTLLDLNQLLYGIVSTLGSSLPATACLDWSPWSTPVMVSGKLSLLNHAFSAVVANALEALPDAGGLIQVSCEAAADHAVIRVRDNGTGFDGSLALALNPFHSTKNPEEHCGLGLTIAERFLSSHGGSLVLEAASPQGVQVTVTLPLAAGREVPDGV